jgi:hypothetical protein
VGLGFSLAGGADLENKVITVSEQGGAWQSQRGWRQTCQYLVLGNREGMTPGHGAGGQHRILEESPQDHSFQEVCVVTCVPVPHIQP